MPKYFTEIVLPHTLRMEGGFVNHPSDPGGATNFGVTQGTYNAYRTRRGLAPRTVKDISPEEVNDIYRAQYWERGKGPQIADTHPKTALVHFDGCVNHGVAAASRFLQNVVSTTADGIIGPKTLEALRTLPDVHVAHQLLDLRRKFYERIVANKPSQRVFLKGWMNRLRSTAEAIT